MLNMPTVYVLGEERSTTRFHRDSDCIQITKRPARGDPRELREVDLNDLRFQNPCRTCYPDAPRVKFLKRFCPICNKNRAEACKHNGGVLIIEDYVFHTQTLLHEPGDSTFRARYVWPDKVRHHISA